MNVVIDGVEYVPTKKLLAIVEGRGVYEGDVLYAKDGSKIIANHIGFTWDDQDNFAKWIKSLSWNPPKPKTITVELLREDAEYWLSIGKDWERKNTAYNTSSARYKEASINFYESVKEAMK
jgi:hypothetical protein